MRWRAVKSAASQLTPPGLQRRRAGQGKCRGLPAVVSAASLGHPRLPQVATARGRGGSQRTAASTPLSSPFDPDTYCDEVEDPDDYSFASTEAAIGSHTGVDSSSGSEPGGSSASAQDGNQGAESPNGKGATTRYDADTVPPSFQPWNVALLPLLLLGRLVAHLRIAVGATARVTLQLAAEAVGGLCTSAVKAKDKAGESFKRSSAAKRMERWKRTLEAVQHEWPEDLWGKMVWLWERPDIQKLRLTVSMANFSLRLPALVALVATQIGLLSTSLSLPMLAPLLLGTGMLLRSIRTNASLIFPRMGLLVVLLWLLWFANSVIQNTVAYLRKQGAIDQRMASNINSGAEVAVLLTAAVILLSMLGVNVSALLLPAGVALAFAAKDLSHNFLAGFFLMMVQPFRLGDRVGVTLPNASPGGFGGAGPWFEGVCEKVDLRYTSLRQGKRRLMVPNSAFLQQPFMILEDVPAGAQPDAPPGPPPGAQSTAPAYQPFVTHDGRHIWQAYVNGGPLHQELQREAAQQQAGSAQQQHGGLQPQPVAQGPLNGQESSHDQLPGAAIEQHGQGHAAQGPTASGRQEAQAGVGLPLAQQPQPQGYPGVAPVPQQPASPLYYGMGPPPGSFPPPGSYPGGMGPPGAYSIYPRSHPLPPQTFM